MPDSSEIADQKPSTRIRECSVSRNPIGCLNLLDLHAESCCPRQANRARSQPSTTGRFCELAFSLNVRWAKLQTRRSRSSGQDLVRFHTTRRHTKPKGLPASTKSQNELPGETCLGDKLGPDQANSESNRGYGQHPTKASHSGRLVIRRDLSVVSLRSKRKMFIASSAHSVVGLIVVSRSSAAPWSENNCSSSFMGPIRKQGGHPALERPR